VTISYWEKHGKKSLPCLTSGSAGRTLARTLARALERYRPERLASLENQTSKPHRLRQPTWTSELMEAVAGTIVEGKADTTSEKIARMKDAGISVAEEIAEIPGIVKQRLAEAGA
jgi:hypothetical protein